MAISIMCIKLYKAAPITSVLDLKTGLALGAVKATSDESGPKDKTLLMEKHGYVIATTYCCTSYYVTCRVSMNQVHVL